MRFVIQLTFIPLLTMWWIALAASMTKGIAVRQEYWIYLFALILSICVSILLFIFRRRFKELHYVTINLLIFIYSIICSFITINTVAGIEMKVYGVDPEGTIALLLVPITLINLCALLISTLTFYVYNRIKDKKD
jgi:hypothetical protein